MLQTAQTVLTYPQALAMLAARIFVGMAFFSFRSDKVAIWESTLALFADKYHVPLLPPHVAAVAITFGELFSPVLLIQGLFGRFSAMCLFCVNIMALISLSEIAPAA